MAASVVRVEEDWELVVGTPDPDSDSPQVVCVVSPLCKADSVHATFEVNHRSVPQFVPGGVQLVVWNGEAPLAIESSTNEAPLAHAGETIRWTQCMEVNEGQLTFEILGGSSTTWGAFGAEGSLRATVPTSLANLDAYTPSVSVKGSGVNYAGHRVHSLVLKRIRVHLSNGEQVEDTTARTVHSH